MKKELVVSQDPKSPISEIIRTLRTNLQFFGTKGKLKTLLLTSTMPSEGKSWISSNLAIAFAQAGKRVILIDADMRKGRLYKMFEIAPTPGLSNYLSGIDENENASEREKDNNLINHLQTTEVENLLVMPAGNVPPNPSELLSNERMVDMLERMKQVSDIVIIDGTPVQLVTDSLIISRLSDATVIVTADKKTRKEDLKKVINNIEQIGGKLAGIIINQIPTTYKIYEKSYYYGSSSKSKTTTSKTRAKRQADPKKNEYEMMGENDD